MTERDPERQQLECMLCGGPGDFDAVAERSRFRCKRCGAIHDFDEGRAPASGTEPEFAVDVEVPAGLVVTTDGRPLATPARTTQAFDDAESVSVSWRDEELGYRIPIVIAVVAVGAIQKSSFKGHDTWVIAALIGGPLLIVLYLAVRRMSGFEAGIAGDMIELRRVGFPTTGQAVYAARDRDGEQQVYVRPQVIAPTRPRAVAMAARTFEDVGDYFALLIEDENHEWHEYAVSSDIARARVLYDLFSRAVDAGGDEEDPADPDSSR